MLYKYILMVRETQVPSKKIKTNIHGDFPFLLEKEILLRDEIGYLPISKIPDIQPEMKNIPG